MAKTRGEVSKPNLSDMKIRLPAALKAEVERVSEQSGASMNSEIVARLEKSFQIEKELGGSSSFDIWRQLQDQVNAMERETGKSWREDVTTFYAVCYRIDQVLRDNEPPSPAREIERIAWSESRVPWNAMRARIDFLRSLGAVKRLEDRERPVAPTPYADIHLRQVERALRMFGYLPVVDLELAPEQWTLSGADGVTLGQDDRIAIKAALWGLPPLRETYIELFEKFKMLEEPHRQARRQGRELAREWRKRNDKRLGDLFSEEDESWR